MGIELYLATLQSGISIHISIAIGHANINCRVNRCIILFGNNRTAIEINCEDVSFGETKKNRENSGRQTSDFIPTDEADDDELPF